MEAARREEREVEEMEAARRTEHETHQQPPPQRCGRKQTRARERGGGGRKGHGGDLRRGLEWAAAGEIGGGRWEGERPRIRAGDRSAPLHGGKSSTVLRNRRLRKHGWRVERVEECVMDQHASDAAEVMAGEARVRAPVRRAGASAVRGAAGEEGTKCGAGAPARWLIAPRLRRDRLRRRGRT